MNIKKKRLFVLAATIVINLCIGSGYAWSVFAGPLVKEFGWTAAATALTFTVANSVSPVMMITGGKLQDKFGPRWVIFAGGILYGGGIYLSSMTTSVTWLYATYGITGGFGMGLVYSSTIANAVKFFPEKRGLVSGLVTGGYGFGPVIFAPILQRIIAASGVLFTFKVLGILNILVITFGSQFIATAPANYIPEGWTPPQSKTSSVSSDKTWLQMISDPVFYLLFLMLTFGATSGLMIISQASTIAQDMVLVNAGTAAIAVSLVAIANTSGRIIWGVISDKFGRYNVLPVMYVLSASMMFLLTTVKEGQLLLFTACAMTIGFCFGGFMGVFPALTADSFGTKNNGINYGIMFIGFALGGYIGPMLAANIKAANNGDYTKAFLIASLLSVIGILLTFAVRILKKRITLQLKQAV